MNIDELLAREIFTSHPNDLFIIRKYIAWVKIRRQVNNIFYPAAHWISPATKQTIHWVGG